MDKKFYALRIWVWKSIQKCAILDVFYIDFERLNIFLTLRLNSKVVELSGVEFEPCWCVKETRRPCLVTIWKNYDYFFCASLHLIMFCGIIYLSQMDFKLTSFLSILSFLFFLPFKIGFRVRFFNWGILIEF